MGTSTTSLGANPSGKLPRQRALPSGAALCDGTRWGAWAAPRRAPCSGGERGGSAGVHAYFGGCNAWDGEGRHARKFGACVRGRAPRAILLTLHDSARARGPCHSSFRLFQVMRSPLLCERLCRTGTPLRELTRGCESRLRRYHHSCPADEAPDLISDLPAGGCAPPRRSPSARPGPPQCEPNPARRSPPPSLPYKVDTSRPSLRTNWTRLVHEHAGPWLHG